MFASRSLALPQAQGLAPRPSSYFHSTCSRPFWSGSRTGSPNFSRAILPTPRAPVERPHTFPFDQAWAPNVDYQSIAPSLFAFSLFPYMGFLFFLTRSGVMPRLALGGFYFLLVFVFVTIPAGIYAKLQYGTNLANVDWLHGSAESLLTITNLLIVLGMRQAIQEAEQAKSQAAAAPPPPSPGEPAPSSIPPAYSPASREVDTTKV